MSYMYMTLEELGYTACEHPFREEYWRGSKYTVEQAVVGIIEPIGTIDYDNTTVRCLWCNAILENGEWGEGIMDFPISKHIPLPASITNEHSADLKCSFKWKAIFGSDTVPIKSMLPARASFPGKGNTAVYELDLTELTSAQLERLVNHIARKFDCTPELVSTRLAEEGMPILVDDVFVTGYDIGLFL